MSYLLFSIDERKKTVKAEEQQTLGILAANIEAGVVRTVELRLQTLVQHVRQWHQEQV